MSTHRDDESPSFLQLPPSVRGKAWQFFKISRAPSHALLHVRSDIHLYSCDEIPPYQHNPYITHGYRSYLSAKQCCKSIFIKSNELVNIWTHGGMFIYLFLLLFYDQLLLLPSLRSATSDHFIFLTFSLCSQICMLCSACYHTFNCHVHERVSRRWYSADLVGITLGMLGCYLIGLYYAFYCFMKTQIFYVVLVCAMIITSVMLMVHPKYLSKRWRRTRIAHLTGIVVSGLIPTLHWYRVTTTEEVQMLLPSVIILYGFLGAGMMFYVSKVPERCKPGGFNMCGHSHNWWHLFVSCAFYHWRQVAITVMSHRIQHPCVS